MNKKVWVISEDDWRGTPLERRLTGGRESARPVEKVRAEKRPAPGVRELGVREKSPAVSFSLSMLLWGSGQMYVGDYRAGWRFMASMLLFYLTLSGLVIYQPYVSRFLAEREISASMAVLGFLVLFVVGLVAWLCNAIDAYYRTTDSRSEPFRGARNRLWPLLCSFLFPGWGQFLNGQPGKGFFFALFSLAGIASGFVLLIAPSVWPLLKAGQDRFVFETYIAAALSTMPIFFVMWLASMFDAVKSSLNLLKEKPGPHAGFRVKRQGFVHDLVPRGTAILGLLLAISVGMQFAPKQYYLDSLEHLRLEMVRNEMEIVPDMLGKAIRLLDRKVQG